MGNESKFALSNPNLSGDSFLYHLNLSTEDNLKQRFGDVKCLCMGGTESRMKTLANMLYEEFYGHVAGLELEPVNISAGGNRYCMYKVGPVIIANHGIGNPSASVVLNEFLKLFHYAGCTEVIVLRAGTCGGLGPEPGSVVITEKVYNGLLENCHKQAVCGTEVSYPTNTDLHLAEELYLYAGKLGIPATKGNTMSTDDFYEGQARLDGAFCNYSNQEKKDFLKRAHDEFGIRNIEMESSCFTSLCGRANIKCGIVCVAIVDRLKCDEVDGSRVGEWEETLQKLIVEFLKNRFQQI